MLKGQHGHHYQKMLAHVQQSPLWESQDWLTLTIHLYLTSIKTWVALQTINQE